DMKNNIFIQRYLYFIAGFCLVTALVLSSCKKYDSAGFTPGDGAPAISSVHTWSKIDTTVLNDTIKSYNASGDLVETIRSRTNLPHPFDSVTEAGSLGNYYIIYGSNLGSATSITFNGYNAYFNRALLTDHSIIVQV